MNTRPKHDDPEQSKLFIETAREFGADEAPESGDILMGRLAAKPPKPHDSGKKNSKKRSRKDRDHV